MKRGGPLKRTPLARGTKPKACRQCGASFMPYPTNYARQVFCSKVCSAANQRDKAAAKPVPAKGRTNRDADRKWREAVLARDGRVCSRCGTTQGVMHAHHVMTRRQRPDLKHDVSNGIVLCDSDHQWVHMNPADAAAEGLLGGPSYEVERNRERVEKRRRTMRGEPS